ncbi:ThiF family adenylyltransferase [Heyndrickxia ginsengihumi]|uniref:ThiF family adenylyltransferase n=1 Tax=Heyndrickxia ginsengihumi TaxID=363870 RepID=UPI00046FB09A|nr:ThiF family adenylyltransferase [Heyndrickxia ginsengihumi]MBE6182885.1 thiamine biosynthesis protein MoeB [Bacillus sp. (in: firmicutes)]
MTVEERYSKQILFDRIGESGQQKISTKTVTVVGLGALGSSSAEMLARAGVGRMNLVDRDYVELTNLHRQQLFTEKDVINKTPKAVAAQRRLQEINSSVEIKSYIQDAGANELEQLAKESDLLIDATDNFETRFMMNDAAVKYNIPLIYGACVGAYGVTYTVIPGKTPCLNCLAKYISLEAMPTCDTVGVIMPVVTQVTSHQVIEALKILTEQTEACRDRLLSFDLWKNQTSSIDPSVLHDIHCPSCGSDRTYPYLQQENIAKTTVLCGRDTVQIRPGKRWRPDFKQLSDRFKTLPGKTMTNDFLLAYEDGNIRFVLFQDGRALIHGTKNVIEAKNIYHRYLS